MKQPFFKRIHILDKALKKNAKYISYKNDIAPYLLEEASKVYFFNKLNNLAWLDILVKENIFTNIPNNIFETSSRGFKTIHAPDWPQAKYLLNVVDKCNKEQQNIILSILKMNRWVDNYKAHEYFCDIALKLEPELTEEFVKHDIYWLEKQETLYFDLPEKYANIIEYLLNNDNIDVALKLTRTLLETTPITLFDINEVKEKEGDLYYNAINPSAKFDISVYEILIDKYLNVLIKKAGMEALSLFCDLLYNTLSYKYQQIEPQDNSYIWRNDIENPSDISPHGIQDLLVTAVKDIADNIIIKEKENVLSIIASYKYKIFRRIDLYLRTKHFDVDTTETINIMIDKETFNDFEVENEYIKLINKHFGKMDQKDKEAYFALVDPTKDVKQWIINYKINTSQEPSEEMIQKRNDIWIYEKINPIKDYLEGNWKEKYEIFKNKYGIMPITHKAVSWGPIVGGPIGAKEFKEIKDKPLGDIISFLVTFQPKGSFTGPSYEGIGRDLSIYVQEAPDKYYEVINQIDKLEPIFIRFIIEGFQKGLAAGKTISWPKVLDICRKVSEKPVKPYEKRVVDPFGKDETWNGAKLSSLRLVEEGLVQGEKQIPIELKDNVWSIIKVLTGDPNPTLEYEREYGAPNMSYSMLSINSLRGEALHACFKFTLWISSENKERVLPKEVKDVLETHLDKKQDPSLTIHSVYGQWLPWLFNLDKYWTLDRIGKIFPRENELKSFRTVAWDAYLWHCAPYDDIFEYLKDEYRKSVLEITSETVFESGYFESKINLAKHLLTYYWRGKIDLKEKGNLIDLLFSRNNIELNKEAMNYIGHGLYDTKVKLKQVFLQRAKKIWEYRYNIIKIKTNPNQCKELQCFGLWFSSKQLNWKWALAQLYKVLKLVGDVEHEGWVFDNLANIAKTYPDEVIKCTYLMVQNDQKDWVIPSSLQEIKTIIKTIKKSRNIKAKGKAIDLIHLLGSKGYLEFREYLN